MIITQPHVGIPEEIFFDTMDVQITVVKLIEVMCRRHNNPY
ncbi:Uncharacterised protein [Vibrio cholerae]|nr:Uncharacterised protein [Vibrio cholerae]CSI97021.1 Uncharacterised protein [Vibrio cholerae]